MRRIRSPLPPCSHPGLAIVALVAASLGASPTFHQLAPRVVFTDITASTGITFTHTSAPDKKYVVESMSGGVGLFDFDKDGWLDVYVVNSPTVANPAGARSALWRNNHDGTFIDVTERAGVGSPGWAMGVATGDYDNDGWEDTRPGCTDHARTRDRAHPGEVTTVPPYRAEQNRASARTVSLAPQNMNFNPS